MNAPVTPVTALPASPAATQSLVSRAPATRIFCPSLERKKSLLRNWASSAVGRARPDWSAPRAIQSRDQSLRLGVSSGDTIE